MKKVLSVLVIVLMSACYASHEAPEDDAGEDATSIYCLQRPRCAADLYTSPDELILWPDPVCIGGPGAVYEDRGGTIKYTTLPPVTCGLEGTLRTHPFCDEGQRPVCLTLEIIETEPVPVEVIL